MTNVLTLRLDEASQAHFDRLRQQHFPPSRNQIAAHVTLFHTLPDSDEIAHQLSGIADAQEAFPVEVTGVRSLGKGVAYRLASPDLLRLHGTLAQAFHDALTPQDAQRFQPHVVVQNKVTPEQARELLKTLEQRFVRRTVHAQGLDLWHYLGGPWEHAQTFLFGQESSATCALTSDFRP